MATNYRIYSGGMSGGPVDYSTPVATVSGLSWATPALPANAVVTYAVRAFDTVSGLEEPNVDARVTIRVNAAQADITGLPNAPTGLTATPAAGATARVAWQYNPGGQGGVPTGFRVYVGTPTPNYGAVAATVPYAAGKSAYLSTLAGPLVDGSIYQVGVRSYNATGTESNTTVASFTADGTGPSPVDSLTAAVVP
jgi:hypothetical protein